MRQVSGTIRLGRLHVNYEEPRFLVGARHAVPLHGDEYFLEQRAVVRLSEDLVKIKRPEDYTVFCDATQFTKQARKRPSPLQYFIASLGFCMFSQMGRFASRMKVAIDDAEMDLRVAYDLRAKRRVSDYTTAAQELSYFLKIKSQAPVEKVMRVAQLTNKGCHTVNSMRKRVPVNGTLLLNEREFAITD